MKTLALFLFFITSFFVRASRWLGFVQQKEYRFDRMILFLLSDEGKAELLRFFPKRSDFSRIGLKRPKVTGRILLVTAFFVFFSMLYITFSFNLTQVFLLGWYPYPLWYNVVALLLLATFYLLFLPFFVLLSAVPTALIAFIQTYKKLLQARAVLQKSNAIIVGVTGSYGKTSLKFLLSSVLETTYSVFFTPKSYNTKYSVANSIIEGYSDQQVAIIEYAAYKKGEIKTLASWIRPQLAILTGLTKQHLGLFGSLENIISAKAELVESLPPKAKVICNAYDPQTQLIHQNSQAKDRTQLVAVNSEYQKVVLTHARLNKEGKLQFSWNQKVVQTKLLGMHYLELVHVVIVAALELKVSQEAIAHALESFIPNEKFIFSYTLGSGCRVIDDGQTSNPKGFFAIIKLAQALHAQKKVLITSGIVDLGADSSHTHLELAQQAKKVFTQVIYVGESGKKEFESVFGELFLDTPEQFSQVYETLSDEDTLVVEGNIPSWVQAYLQ